MLCISANAHHRLSRSNVLRAKFPKKTASQSNPAPSTTIDNTMVKAIARAFRWQWLLENGTYRCIEDIARGERIGASFVSRIIRLALLAPDIVELVLEGRQPAALTLKELMRAFPVEWDRQRGFFLR